MKKLILGASLALALTLPVSAMAETASAASAAAAAAASADVSAKLGAAFSTSSQAGNEYSFGSFNGSKFNLVATGTATNRFAPLTGGGFANTSSFSNHFTGTTGGLNTYNGLQASFASGSASFDANIDANLKAAAFGAGDGEVFKGDF